MDMTFMKKKIYHQVPLSMQLAYLPKYIQRVVVKLDYNIF